MIEKKVILAAPLTLMLLAGVASAQASYNTNNVPPPGNPPSIPGQQAPTTPIGTNATSGAQQMPNGTQQTPTQQPKTTPRVPNTGAGGAAAENGLVLSAASIAALAAAWLLARRRAQ